MLRSLSNFGGSLATSAVRLVLQHSLFCRKIIEKGDEQRVRKAIPLMVQINVLVGIFCTALNLFLLRYKQRLFTDNQALIDVFPRIIWQSSISLFLVCITTGIDGIFIGTNRVNTFLQACALSTISAWIYALLISMPLGLGTLGAWNGILLFAVVRFAFYALKWRRLPIFAQLEGKVSMLPY